MPKITIFHRKSFKIILLVLLTIAGAIAALLSYNNYTQTRKELDQLKQQTLSPGTQSDKESAAVIKKVRELIDFPENDTPTVATVNDASKLTDQSFFDRSQNGDKVLVFSQSKRAVLYRPSTHKIIEVAPVNLNSSASSSGQVASAAATPTSKPSASPTPTISNKPLSILLLNGTTTAGITSKLETPIKKFYPQATFDKQSAAKSDYSTTQIIALNENSQAYVDKLAVELNFEKLSESPYGEDLAGEYDIAIIVGSDQIKN